MGMAGMRGKSGPPGNRNAFRHGLAAVHNRRIDGELTENERDIRAEILAGLIADSGGEAQISTATRIVAEITSSDVALLITLNQAIENVIKNNQKARQNPKALAQLDGYKRPLVGSLSANLQRFGMELVGHKTMSIYSRYAICDESMLKDAAQKLEILHRADRQESHGTILAQ